MRSSVSPIDTDPECEIGSVRINSHCEQEGWKTETDFNFLVLDRIVLADFDRPLPMRLAKYLVAFGDFIVTGTAFRFSPGHGGSGFIFSIHFWCLRCLQPPVMRRRGWPLSGWARRTGQAGLSRSRSFHRTCHAGQEMVDQPPDGPVVVLALFHSRMAPGRRIADAALCRRNRRKVRARQYDEVILIGHSTGGMLMLDVAARCLAIDPAFSGHAEKTALLTLGSTALKAGYHPASAGFRQGVQRLVDDGKLEWVEIQCLTDAINFYKTDPVTEMGLTREAERVFPLARTVRIKTCCNRKPTSA